MERWVWDFLCCCHNNTAREFRAQPPLVYALMRSAAYLEVRVLQLFPGRSSPACLCAFRPPHVLRLFLTSPSLHSLPVTAASHLNTDVPLQRAKRIKILNHLHSTPCPLWACSMERRVSERKQGALHKQRTKDEGHLYLTKESSMSATKQFA